MSTKASTPANGQSEADNANILDAEAVTTVSKSTKSGSLELSAAKKVAHPGLPSNRPVEPLHLDIIGTEDHRPVVSNHLHVSGYLGGNRPILAGNLRDYDSPTLPNHRPIASNYLGETSELMGYLD